MYARRRPQVTGKENPELRNLIAAMQALGNLSIRILHPDVSPPKENTYNSWKEWFEGLSWEQKQMAQKNTHEVHKRVLFGNVEDENQITFWKKVGEKNRATSRKIMAGLKDLKGYPIARFAVMDGIQKGEKFNAIVEVNLKKKFWILGEEDDLKYKKSHILRRWYARSSGLERLHKDFKQYAGKIIPVYLDEYKESVDGSVIGVKVFKINKNGTVKDVTSAWEKNIRGKYNEVMKEYRRLLRNYFINADANPQTITRTDALGKKEVFTFKKLAKDPQFWKDVKPAVDRLRAVSTTKPPAYFFRTEDPNQVSKKSDGQTQITARTPATEIAKAQPPQQRLAN